jgi:hypothetical protein
LLDRDSSSLIVASTLSRVCPESGVCLPFDNASVAGILVYRATYFGSRT